jgi:hypothetical protein
MTELEQLQQIMTLLVVRKRADEHTNTQRGQDVINLITGDDDRAHVKKLINVSVEILLHSLNAPVPTKKPLRLLSNFLNQINSELKKKVKYSYLDKEDVNTIIHAVKIIKALPEGVSLSDILENIEKNIKQVENAQLFTFMVAKTCFKETSSLNFTKYINQRISEVITNFVHGETTPAQKNKLADIVKEYYKIFSGFPVPTRDAVVQQRAQAFKKIKNFLKDNYVASKHNYQVRLQDTTINAIMDMFAPSAEDKIPDDLSSIREDAMSVVSYESDEDSEDLALAEAKALELTRLILEVKALSDTSTLEPQNLINIIPERLITLSNDIPHAIQRKFS